MLLCTGVTRESSRPVAGSSCYYISTRDDDDESVRRKPNNEADKKKLKTSRRSFRHCLPDNIRTIVSVQFYYKARESRGPLENRPKSSVRSAEVRRFNTQNVKKKTLAVIERQNQSVFSGKFSINCFRPMKPVCIFVSAEMKKKKN